MAIEYIPLIQKYGYLATFAGSLVEGESVLILSGLAAHQGYLSLSMVIAVGALGGALGDLVFFMLGRRYGGKLLSRFPRYEGTANRVRAMIEAHPNATILGVRFMYGLRIAGPAVIGASRVPLPRFIALNAIGALLWSGCWSGAGYLLGRAAERLLGNLARFEGELFGAVLLIVVLGAVTLRIWEARRRFPNRRE
jgi:membrane protein DedA with SNARE-associated domain